MVRFEDHKTVLVVAVLGRTDSTNLKVAIRERVNVVRLSDIADTAVETRTTIDADLFPSCVVIVIIVEPFPTAVIRPVLDTVAIEGCRDIDVTVLFVAFTGRTVAIDWNVNPLPNEILVEFRDTLCTPTKTDTATVAVLAMSMVWTVMMVDPELIPVITPELDTVAIDGFADDHVTILFAAFDGNTVAVIVLVLPVPIDILVGDTDTDETATVMDITHDAVNDPQRAVMTADPTETAVIIPDPFTVALLEFDVHTTVLLVAFEGRTVATSVNVFPGCIVAVV